MIFYSTRRQCIVFLSSLVVLLERGVCLSGGDYLRGKLYCEGAIVWEAIIRRAIIQGAIIQGAIIRGAIFLGGNCPRTILKLVYTGSGALKRSGNNG